MLTRSLAKYSRVLTRGQMLCNLNVRTFRPSVAVNKKPSIGDAVTILQSKVSSINQVVSTIILYQYQQ